MIIDRYTLYYRTFFTIFWIAMCWGFVSEQLLTPLQSLSAVVFLAIDAILIILGFATLRTRRDIWIFLSYLVLAVTSTLFLNKIGIAAFLNGTRDFLGLILVVPVLRYFFTSPRAAEFMTKVNRQLLIWLYVQAFCIIWQFLRYGAGDAVGGSMGYGASGMASMLIYITSFFLVTRKWDPDNIILSIKRNAAPILLILPTFLNETKVSFILLAFYVILLIRFDRKLIIRLFYIIPLSIVGLIAIFNVYLSITHQKAEVILSREFAEEYFYGIDLDHMIDVAIMVQDGTIEVDPRDWWAVDIPRFAKFVVITPKLRDQGGGVWFGAGVGHFKGGRLFKETRFGAENRWLLQGSRPMLFFVYTQLGIIGIAWFLVVASMQLFCRRSRARYATQLQILLGIALAIICFYNDSLRIFNFCTVLFYMALYLRYRDDSSPSEARPAANQLPSPQPTPATINAHA